MAGNELGGVRREAVICAHHYGIHVRPYRNTVVADVSGAGSVAQQHRTAGVF